MQQFLPNLLWFPLFHAMCNPTKEVTYDFRHRGILPITKYYSFICTLRSLDWLIVAFATLLDP